MTKNSRACIAVIGAGTMGSSLAQKYATHDHSVVLVDQNEHALKKSRSFIEETLHQGVEKNIFTKIKAQEIFNKIQFTTDIKDCHNAELIIEAVFENLEVKQKLFGDLERVCSKETIFATNTSSLRVTDIQKNLKHPERMLGLHYFFPPAKNRLVELIGTDATDIQFLKKARALQESINKVIITSKDSPGFIVNRFFVPWLNESMRIVEERIANIATVEAAAKNFFAIKMGPFQLMNVTGLPIAFHSCNALAQSLGEFYAPCPLITSHISSDEKWDIAGDIQTNICKDISARLLLITSAIGYQMVFNEQVCSQQDVDRGAQVGLLWPKGPFALLKEHVAEVKSAYARLHETNNLPVSKQFLEHIELMV